MGFILIDRIVSLVPGKLAVAARTVRPDEEYFRDHFVVAIACGAGTQAMLWAELGHRVRALDINEPLLSVACRRAAKRRLPIDYRLGTAHIISTSFDKKGCPCDRPLCST